MKKDAVRRLFSRIFSIALRSALGQLPVLGVTLGAEGLGLLHEGVGVGREGPAQGGVADLAVEEVLQGNAGLLAVQHEGVLAQSVDGTDCILLACQSKNRHLCSQSHS